MQNAQTSCTKYTNIMQNANLLWTVILYFVTKIKQCGDIKWTTQGPTEALLDITYLDGKFTEIKDCIILLYVHLSRKQTVSWKVRKICLGLSVYSTVY